MMRGRKGRRRTRMPISLNGRGKALRRGAELLVPKEARAHLRTAIQEGLLALASLAEAALKAVEGSARAARGRVERIPVRRKR